MVDKYKVRTQREAARYVGCSPRTIRRWGKDGKIKKDGDHYDLDDLDDCKWRSSMIRGLYDADILRFREQVKAAADKLIALRSKLNSELDEMENKLLRVLGEKV